MVLVKFALKIVGPLKIKFNVFLSNAMIDKHCKKGDASLVQCIQDLKMIGGLVKGVALIYAVLGKNCLSQVNVSYVSHTMQ